MTSLKVILLSGACAAALLAQKNPATNWSGYSGDPGGRRYSPLTQINTKNVTKLKLTWQYGIAAAGISQSGGPGRGGGGISPTEAVPIVVDGVMYTPTVQRTIVAIEPETGKELWKYELGRAGSPLRGVTYWPGDKEYPAEIFVGTNDGHLIALNAKHLTCQGAREEAEPTFIDAGGLLFLSGAQLLHLFGAERDDRRAAACRAIRWFAACSARLRLLLDRLLDSER